MREYDLRSFQAFNNVPPPTIARYALLAGATSAAVAGGYQAWRFMIEGSSPLTILTWLGFILILTTLLVVGFRGSRGDPILAVLGPDAIRFRFQDGSWWSDSWSRPRLRLTLLSWGSAGTKGECVPDTYGLKVWGMPTFPVPREFYDAVLAQGSERGMATQRQRVTGTTKQIWRVTLFSER